MTTTADLDVGAPAWHRDPGDPRHITYWNGDRWTVHMRWAGGGWQRCGEDHEPPPLDAVTAPAAVARAVSSLEVPAAAAPTDTSPRRRSRRRLYGLLALLVLLAGGGAGYYVVKHRSSSTATTPPPPAASSASQVLHRSLLAARSKPSVHLASTESAGGAGVSASYDVSARQGQETIDGGSAGNATVVATAGAVYLKADAAFLQGSLRLSAAAAARGAGQWVEFLPGDSGYQQLASGMTLASAVLEATPTLPLHLGAVEVVDGQRVVGISGGLPRNSVAGTTGHQVLYVEAAAPYLPVELEVTAAVRGQRATSTVTFSQWGETVTPTIPTGTAPASSLGS